VYNFSEKTGNEPKVKAGTKRKRHDASETLTSSGGTSQVNPVLAGILYLVSLY
jgi:hypothetical protein